MFYQYNMKVLGFSLQLFLRRELARFETVCESGPKWSQIWSLIILRLQSHHMRWNWYRSISQTVFTEEALRKQVQTTNYSRSTSRHTEHSAVGRAKGSQTWAWKHNFHHSRTVLNSIMSQFRWFCHSGSGGFIWSKSSSPLDLLQRLKTGSDAGSGGKSRQALGCKDKGLHHFNADGH